MFHVVTFEIMLSLSKMMLLYVVCFSCKKVSLATRFERFLLDSMILEPEATQGAHALLVVEAKKQAIPWNIALLVAIGGVVIGATLVLLWFHCRSRPNVEAANKAQEIIRQQTETSPQEDSLDQRLSQLRRQRFQLLTEQAHRKEKLLKVTEALMVVEAEKKGNERPTQCEVVRKLEEALRGTKYIAERGILTTCAYAAPLVVQSTKVIDALDRHANAAQQRVKEAAVDETKKMLDEIRGILKVDDMSDLPRQFLDFELPELASVLGSIFAPATLRIASLLNTILLVLGVVSWCLSLLVILVDFHAPCVYDANDAIKLRNLKPEGLLGQNVLECR